MKNTKKIILCVLVFVVVLSAIVIPISATSVDNTPAKYGVYNPFTYVSLEDTVAYQQYWLFNDPRRVNNYRYGDNVLTKERMLVYASGDPDYRDVFEADTFLNVSVYTQQWGLRTLFWQYLADQRQTSINRISIYYDNFYTHGDTESITFRYTGANGRSCTLNMSFDIDVTNQTTGEITTYHFTKSTSVNVEGETMTVYLLDGNAVSNYLRNDYNINLNATHFVVKNYTLSLFLIQGNFNQFSIYSQNGPYYETDTTKHDLVKWQYAVDNMTNFDFSWLLEAVEAFLAFEILPGLKLYGILIATAGMSVFIWFLKMFAGG